MSGPAPPSLKERLGKAVVTLRSELEFTRTVFRGQPWYVVRHPITFQSHRLTPSQYEMLMALCVERPLEESFTHLVERKMIAEAKEESFYEFVFQLHRMGMLDLPVADDKALYQRFEQKRSAGRKAKLLGFLFMQVPLFHPDEFLERTLRFARPFFTKAAFYTWLALMALAVWVAANRWDELAAPLLTLLEFGNLPWVGLVLIVLKCLHELGHAYACKTFGGAVPEMGAIFIVGTPCAYVDATAAWGFSSKRQRLIVSLGGMYVESICACLALFVWASTGPSFLNTLMYQTVVMASLVTVAFNINPLMRFDGYYVLSDLVEVPNLRQRSSDRLLAVFDRVALGVKAAAHKDGPWLSAFLLLFGISSTIYKITLTLGICVLVATKIYFLGLALAVYYVGSSMIRFVWKSINHLWFDPATARVRLRAIFVSMVAFLAIPCAFALQPISIPMSSEGILERENETLVRAESSGFLRSLSARGKRRVLANEGLALLENLEQRDGIRQARLELASLDHQIRAQTLVDRHEVRKSLAHRRMTRTRLREDEKRHASLEVRAPESGDVLWVTPDHAEGSFVEMGDPLVLVGDGGWLGRFLVHEETFSSCAPRVGDRVECRSSSDPRTPCSAIVRSIAPAGSSEVTEESLTQLGGGAIVVDPGSQAATEAFVEVVVAFEDSESITFRHGLRMRMRLDSPPRPLIHYAHRKVVDFIAHLQLR